MPPRRQGPLPSRRLGSTLKTRASGSRGPADILFVTSGRRSRQALLAPCDRLTSRQEPTMIATDMQQKIDVLAEQLANLRGYL